MNSSKLRMMIRIRLFEERVAELKLSGVISGPVHTCIGQEAIPTGVCLAGVDYIIGNHRSHGHLIAKGADLNVLMKDICSGDGRSMHVHDASVGAICSTAIVGSGLPLACGVAFASKYKNDGKVTCVFLGDGAVNEGTFYESINLASLWKLPIIFVIENNGVAVTTTLESVSCRDNLIDRADSFDIYQQQVYGQDVDEVFRATKKAISMIRTNNRPAIIEAKTMRFGEHQVGYKIKEKYRDDVDHWIKNRDPIKLFIEKMKFINGLIDLDTDKIYSEERERINEALSYDIR